MKLISSLRTGFLSLFNYPYLPKELLEDSEGPRVMHISDTLQVFIVISSE